MGCIDFEQCCGSCCVVFKICAKEASYIHFLYFYRPSLSPEKSSSARMKKKPGDLLTPRATGWGCVKVISLCINIFASRSGLPGKGGIVLGALSGETQHFYPYTQGAEE